MVIITSGMKVLVLGSLFGNRLLQNHVLKYEITSNSKRRVLLSSTSPSIAFSFCSIFSRSLSHSYTIIEV